MAGISLQFYLNDGSDTFRDYSSGNASFPTIDYFGWSREGYNFLYWNFASDGSGTTYYADAPIPESLRGGSEPFYAIWEAVSPSVTYYKTSSTDLTSVADAIRAKSGTSASLVYPNGFVSAIEDISFDGAVRFLDYDGTVVYAYSATDFANLSAMPANPTHTGLTPQGWNWSLADAKTYVATYGKLDIGQMYVTDDGKTRIYISLVDSVRLSPYLGICPNGTVAVDWGDNTATDTLTGTSLTTVQRVQHTYTSAGDYVITLTVSSGSFAIYGSSSSTNGTYLLTRTNGDIASQRCYQNAIQKIELGANVSIDANAFYNCFSLTSITIPSTVTSIGSYAFQYCYSLASITIPSSVTSIRGSAFYLCYSLASITIPSSVTSISSNAFNECYSLTSITMPSSVTTIGYNAFYKCHSLASVTIPSSVRSIGNNAFDECHSLASITIPSSVTSIDRYMFDRCYSLASITIPSSVTSISYNVFNSCPSLASITIPSSVTSIGSNTFYNCYGVAEYHLLPTTPPTLSDTSAFTGILPDCKIYVPAASLTAYQEATNWSTYASYMVGE